jgi:hypothetical protein
VQIARRANAKGGLRCEPTSVERVVLPLVMVVRRRNRRDDIHRRSLLADFDGTFFLEEFKEYFGADAPGPPRNIIFWLQKYFCASKAVMTLADLPW